MWVGPDEFVQGERKKAIPYCKSCKIRGHGTRYCPVKKYVDTATAVSLDDFLFNSLTME